MLYKMAGLTSFD